MGEFNATFKSYENDKCPDGFYLAFKESGVSICTKENGKWLDLAGEKCQAPGKLYHLETIC